MSKLQLTKNWRDAATLIIAAKSGVKDDSFKLLMLKRSAKSKFMPNAYVFPGGASTSIDFNLKWNDILTKNKIDLQLLKFQNPENRTFMYASNESPGCLVPEIAFRICALRETFEEAGILFLTDKEGNNIVLDQPDEFIGGKHGTLQGWRDEVNKDDSSFLELFRYLGYAPAVKKLHDWCNWLTPTFHKHRFFTMFYLCFLDDIPKQSDDNAETVHSDWMTPTERLTGHIRKDIVLRIPQIYEHCRLKRYESLENLISFTKAREKYGMASWNPVKMSLTDGFVITYPGDDFHNTDFDAESAELHLSLAELEMKSKHLNRLEVLGDGHMIIRNNVEWCAHPPLVLRKVAAMMRKVNFTKTWRDAATLVLAARSGTRNGNETYKLLMLERSAKSKFMPNAYVFPGGVSATVDFSLKWNDIFTKNNVDLTRLLKLQNIENRPFVYTSNEYPQCLAPEIAFRLCAMRETFEEAGILLLTDKEGKNLVLDDPNENIGGKYESLQGWRDEANKDVEKYFELIRFLGCTPAVTSLYDWSTWLTPVFPRTKRFDTMFYICFLNDIPSHGKDCGAEVTGTVWCEPGLLLRNYSIKLEPPQIYELIRMSRYEGFSELTSFVQQREKFGLQTWCASQITLLDGSIVTHPGDDFHVSDVNAEPGVLKVTVEELRMQTINFNRYEIKKNREITIKDNIGFCGHPPLGEITHVRI